MIWLSIASGGAVGAMLRFYLSSSLSRFELQGFPWGIFSVNILGCALMGMLYVGLGRLEISDDLRYFLTVGLLGAFTTFSTFSLQLYELLIAGRVGLALMYGVGSLAGCLAALALGVWLAQTLWGH